MLERDFELAVRLRADIRIRERILIAILVHGPAAAFDHIKKIRNLYRSDPDAFAEIKQTLIDAGMARMEVMELIADAHAGDCACWRCVLRLHAQVMKAHHSRKVDAEG